MKRFLAFLIICIVLLAGLFFFFRPTEKITSSEKEMKPKTGKTSPKKVFTLLVKNKKLVSGDGILTATQGDEITIKITIDEPEELHLHGYDKSVEMEKNTPAQLSFTATKTGRFPFELEESKTDLGVLNVLPK